jgi:hypothetical protein
VVSLIDRKGLTISGNTSNGWLGENENKRYWLTRLDRD